MGSEKRERQRAAREAKASAEVTEAKRSRKVRTAIRVAVVVGLALAFAFAYSVIFGGNGDDGDDREADPEAQEDVSEDEEAAVTTTLADSGDQADPTCPEEDGSSPRQLAFTGPPPMCIDTAATYVAQIETTRGDIELTLDAQQAPVAVNNFVFLARWHYYDGVGFHRVVPDFVIQAGEPVTFQPGEGGPGYRLGDDPDFDGELPDGEPPYPLLSVAMANVGGDPGTSGAQFFVVTGASGESLPPEYTLIGEVTAGEDVVAEIDASGEDRDPDDTPAELTVIEQITISEQTG